MLTDVDLEIGVGHGLCTSYILPGFINLGVFEVMFGLLIAINVKYAAAANTGLCTDVLLTECKMEETLRPVSNLIFN